MKIKKTKEIQFILNSIFVLFTKKKDELIGEVELIKQHIEKLGVSDQVKDYLLDKLDLQLEIMHAEKNMGYVVHGRNQTAKIAVERIINGKI